MIQINKNYLQLLDHPLLGQDAEIELLTLYQSGDNSAREKLIICNRRLVVNIAKGYAHKNPTMDINELISEGTIGLIKAIDWYNTKKRNHPFYLHKWYAINGRINYFIRNAYNHEGRINQNYNIDDLIYRDVVEFARPISPTGYNVLVDHTSMEEFDDIENGCTVDYIKTHMHKCLSKKEIIAVNLRCNGLTYSKMGSILGVKRQYAEVLYNRAINKLKYYAKNIRHN